MRAKAKLGSSVAAVAVLTLVGCGGADSRGEANPPGAPSVAYASVVVVPGPQCANGGVRVDMGIDDNRNGQLDQAEVDASEYVCNGAPGAVSLVRTTPETAGGHCANGGVLIESGLDVDQDSLLDPAEVTTSHYLCHGADGGPGQAGGTTLLRLTPESAGTHCPSGGVLVESGLDLDRDATLDPLEVTTFQYVCNGTTPVPTEGPHPSPLVFVNDLAVVTGEFKAGDYVVASGQYADFLSFSTTVAGVLDAALGTPTAHLFLFTASCLHLADVGDWGPCYLGRADAPSSAPLVPAGSYVLMAEAFGRVDAPYAGEPWETIPYRVDLRLWPNTTLARGVPDPAFGTTGIACAQVGASGAASRIAVQADGGFVVAGFADLDGPAAIGGGGTLDVNALVRFDSTGRPDSSFDADGVSTTDGNRMPAAVAVQGDGKIVLAGELEPSPARFQVLLWRVNANGSTDTTFGAGGRVVTEIPGGSAGATAMAVAPDGKIVVAGYHDVGQQTVLVGRYAEDGSLDPTFGTTGWVTTPAPVSPVWAFSAAAVSLQPDGKVVVAVSAYVPSVGTKTFLLRYRSDGSLDDTFDGDGIAQVGEGSPDAMSIQPDGAILVASWGTAGVRVVRLTASGSLDASFGAGGTVEIAFDPVSSVQMVFAPANRLLVIGNISGSPNAITVGRFSVEGRADLAFGDHGRVLVQDVAAQDVVVGASGEIAVAVQLPGARTCALRLK